ncbi:contact-dependent growth inhibition system immunity protein [Rhizobium skierniewicense]|uniref:contact-dependent growth inhibition system immunity protein n=1 Tax=Rhizobium skierniewicense TaxID=984260 RepID=UPI001574E20B|nr:contact-dependent growth inhibition system immunity protein [Rhizobium skierniewicense]NTF31223.1 hypothetical protein [Rhizobium skierniewicense]
MIRTLFNVLFGWGFPQGKIITDDEFPALFGLFGSYFHQDMDLEYDSEEEAIADWAQFASAEEKQQLLFEMTAFLERYHNDLEGEFTRRFHLGIGPEPVGLTVPAFFNLIRTVVDPERYRRLE